MKENYIKLSYDLSEDTPLYPGTPPVKIKRVKEIKKGDSCNTSFLSFSSHSGTHIDAPKHFISSGKAISDFNIKDFVFERPVIVNCPKKKREAITVRDLLKLKKMGTFDMLLIRTGFSKERDKSPSRYSSENPYISPEAAKWLRANFSKLRAIGIDCISISSRANREAGRKSHRELLRGKALLIIEDVYIPANLKKLKSLLAIPIYVSKSDSAPSTVIGLIK